MLQDVYKRQRQEGRKKVTIIHKANILKSTSGLFLEVARQVAARYPDIQNEEMIVDAACMNLVMYPERFDVMVTTNLFGDILSDLCAGLVGGLGMAPGANIGEGAAIFEEMCIRDSSRAFAMAVKSAACSRWNGRQATRPSLGSSSSQGERQSASQSHRGSPRLPSPSRCQRKKNCSRAEDVYKRQTDNHSHKMSMNFHFLAPTTQDKHKKEKQ